MKQATAEQLVSTKTRAGFQRLEWQQTRERNEALDCRVYARAAAWLVGIDRWDEQRFRQGLKPDRDRHRAESPLPAGPAEPDVTAAIRC